MKGTHFTAWYASDQTQVYTYDSMCNNGYPVYNEDMKFKTHVMGKKPTLPKGFVIWQAIYRLHGEIAAQDKFYKIWMKEYATWYHLYFSEQNLDKLPTMSYHHAGFHEMEKKKNAHGCSSLSIQEQLNTLRPLFPPSPLHKKVQNPRRKPPHQF